MVDIRSRLVFLSLLFTINYNINSLMACPPSGGYSTKTFKKLLQI